MVLNDNIFRKIYNESFDDDYADYQNKNSEYEKSRKRALSGEATLDNVDKRKMTFEFYGKKYYLRKDVNNIYVATEDGKHLAEAYPYQEDSEKIQKIARAILKDAFGEEIGNVALWDCYTTEDFDHLEKIAKLYKEILSVVSNQKSKYDDYYSDGGVHNKLHQAAMNRYDKNHSDYLARRDAENKARQSLYDETPDFEEEGYATWHSKNGDRKVTVLSIDEPNQRAKINTDKGATMYVPLSTLSKYADYGKYF